MVTEREFADRLLKDQNVIKEKDHCNRKGILECALCGSRLLCLLHSMQFNRFYVSAAVLWYVDRHREEMV